MALRPANNKLIGLDLSLIGCIVDRNARDMKSFFLSLRDPAVRAWAIVAKPEGGEGSTLAVRPLDIKHIRHG